VPWYFLAMTRVSIITGASSGIGAELARVFARNGHALVLVARREAKLKALAAEIEAGGGSVPLLLPLDLAARDAAPRLALAMEARDLEPEYVVNNAGFGLHGYAEARDREDLLGMIDLNMRALTDLSLAFTGSLARHRGGILNVASVAGFLPAPASAVYYASKAFVISFSEALHRELRPLGVRVTTLCPGPVHTEFQARAGVTGGKTTMFHVPASAVAEQGYRGLMRGKRMVVPGFGNKLITLAPRLIPRGLLLAAAARRQRSRLTSPASEA
jgi:short-subunit dehydrogenase